MCGALSTDRRDRFRTVPFLRVFWEKQPDLLHSVLFGNESFQDRDQHHGHQTGGKAAVIAVQPGVEAAGEGNDAGVKSAGHDAPPEMVFAGNGGQPAGKINTQHDALPAQPGEAVALAQGDQRVTGKDGPHVAHMAAVGRPAQHADISADHGAGEGGLDEIHVREPERAEDREIDQAQRTAVQSGEIGLVARAPEQRAESAQTAVEDQTENEGRGENGSDENKC